jgi:hypothetical protein
MTRAQRIILIVYCLLVVYCCIWVPWVFSIPIMKDIKDGYAFIWDGPPEGAGVPSLIAIIVRIMAVTALSGAAFLLAGKWRSR